MKVRRAVITLAIGEGYQQLALHTHPLFKRYADRCNADFISIERPKLTDTLKLVTYEKLQVWDVLDGRYDQVLFVDTDIVLLPTAPNVFDLCPPGTFAAANEEGYSMSGAHKRITQDQLGSVEWNAPYFNSGVMLFSPQHRELFNPSGEILKQWVMNPENSDHVMSDQPILNYLLNHFGYDFLDLGYRFNRTRVLTDTHNRFRSHFIHYSGPSGHRYGSRAKQISADARVASDPVALWVSKSLPAYRWIADRTCLDFARYLVDKHRKRSNK